MSPDTAKYLWDAQQAAARALRFVQARPSTTTWPTSCCARRPNASWKLSARRSNQLHKADPATAATIPGLPQAVALRNVLIHAYATVNDRLVSGVVDQHLRPLLSRLSDLLPETNE